MESDSSGGHGLTPYALLATLYAPLSSPPLSSFASSSSQASSSSPSFSAPTPAAASRQQIQLSPPAFTVPPFVPFSPPSSPTLSARSRSRPRSRSPSRSASSSSSSSVAPQQANRGGQSTTTPTGTVYKQAQYTTTAASARQQQQLQRSQQRNSYNKQLQQERERERERERKIEERSSVEVIVDELLEELLGPAALGSSSSSSSSRNKSKATTTTMNNGNTDKSVANNGNGRVSSQLVDPPVRRRRLSMNSSTGSGGWLFVSKHPMLRFYQKWVVMRNSRLYCYDSEHRGSNNNNNQRREKPKISPAGKVPLTTALMLSKDSYSTTGKRHSFTILCGFQRKKVSSASSSLRQKQLRKPVGNENSSNDDAKEKEEKGKEKCNDENERKENGEDKQYNQEWHFVIYHFATKSAKELSEWVEAVETCCQQHWQQPPQQHQQEERQWLIQKMLSLKEEWKRSGQTFVLEETMSPATRARRSSSAAGFSVTASSSSEQNQPKTLETPSTQEANSKDEQKSENGNNSTSKTSGSNIEKEPIQQKKDQPQKKDARGSIPTKEVITPKLNDSSSSSKQVALRSSQKNEKEKEKGGDSFSGLVAMINSAFMSDEQAYKSHDQEWMRQFAAVTEAETHIALLTVHLSRVFKLKKHPLGKFMVQYVAQFNDNKQSYYKTDLGTSITQLVTEVNSFLENMVLTIYQYFGAIRQLMDESDYIYYCNVICEECLFHQIYPVLFGLYIKHHADKDREYVMKVTELSDVKPKDLIENSLFWLEHPPTDSSSASSPLSSYSVKEPYAPAIR
ncbi:Vacuolar sorting protein 9 (VPS9) domain, variant 2 [Balamuthia mandrillaris]